MFGASNQTFEPRVGTAQLIFGIIYVFITLIALSLAFYVRQNGQDGYLQFFMAGLFALMGVKSFFMFSRIKRLLEEGVYYEAKVDSCEAIRGITILKGVCDVKDYGLIHIESRLVGERVAKEINAFMQKHKQDSLPALVVSHNTKHPRGMFAIKCQHGRLIEESAKTKATLEKEAQENAKLNAELEKIAQNTKIEQNAIATDNTNNSEAMTNEKTELVHTSAETNTAETTVTTNNPEQKPQKEQ